MHSSNANICITLVNRVSLTTSSCSKESFSYAPEGDPLKSIISLSYATLEFELSVRFKMVTGLETTNENDLIPS